MIAFQVLVITLQLGISAVNADCPKLSPMQWTNPRDSRCITDPSPINKKCGFSCPFGYALEDDHDRVYFKLVCQPNGTWSGVIYKCVDIWPPTLHCPNDITIVAKKGSPAEVVSWKAPYVNDTSLAVDPNATVTVRSSHQPPYNFTIGRHLVRVTATDKAGNQRSCQFRVTIKDEELPSCSFCPSDIVKVYHSAYERVNWDRPICSDNSHLPPQISSNYQTGQIFRVPGKYKVEYTVKDFAFPKQNIYRGCSFTITLKMAKCPMYDPPKNGALVCLIRDADGSPSVCQVACKIGTDFNLNPALVYICPSSGQWFSIANWPVQRPPWPNCSSGAGPSMQKRLGLKYFFYNGNQTSSEIVSELKHNFMLFKSGPYFPPHFCLHNGVNLCRPEKMQVYVN